MCFTSSQSERTGRKEEKRRYICPCLGERKRKGRKWGQRRRGREGQDKGEDRGKLEDVPQSGPLLPIRPHPLKVPQPLQQQLEQMFTQTYDPVGGILHINHDRTGSDGERPTQKNLHKRESTF